MVVGLITSIWTVTSFAAVIDIRQHGAKGDGKTLDSPAIQKAIDACAAGGGGRVWVSSGDYLCGRLVLKSNVTLYLEPGAVLRSSGKAAHYAGGSSTLLVAKDAENVAVMGRGTLRGIGDADLGRRAGVDDKPNWPQFRAGVIRFEGCRNVTLRGFTIRLSDSWTVNLTFCENVKIDGLSILNNYFRTNSDGIDPVSCRKVHISNCHIVAGDDCIVMKTREGRPCEDVVVTNCTLESIATAIKLGTESSGDFRNIHVSNCSVRNSTVGIGIYLKDGGTVERVTFSHLSLENYQPLGETNVERSMFPIFVDIERRHEDSTIGRIRDLVFDQIQISSGAGVTIQGMPESPIENLTLRGVTFRVTEPIDYTNRKKHVGGRRTVRDQRDTIFVRQPSYIIVANIDVLDVDGIRVLMTPEGFSRFSRSAVCLHHANAFVVRNVLRKPAGDDDDIPAVVCVECGDGVIGDRASP